jgi:hypothetical protein
LRLLLLEHGFGDEASLNLSGRGLGPGTKSAKVRMELVKGGVYITSVKKICEMLDSETEYRVWLDVNVPFLAS